MSDSKESKSASSSSSSSSSSVNGGAPLHAHRPSEVTMSPLLSHSTLDMEKALAYAKHSYPKSKIKILLLERISKAAVDEFVNEGFAVECLDKLSEQELIEKIKDVHALGIRSRTQLTNEVLAAAKKLLVVGAFCIGTDQIDLRSAAQHGTVVFNAPFANTRSVAELVLAEMIMLARQATDRSMECHKGVWNKASSRCYEVRGKTVGIVGYGHVGSQLSVLAESLGMHVIFYDIIPKLPLGNAKPVKTLNELLQNADFVSLHVPATNETHHMIGEEQVKLMRKGGYLLNAARGTVVDIPHVATALKSGYLGGAAFDVFPNEPENVGEKFENALQGAKNTILTPHIGGSTEEAQAAIGLEVSLKMIQFINTGATVGAVNFPDMGLPPNRQAHRILNIHQNIPGVLRDVNNILSEYNVVAQMLMTLGDVGYLMADVDKSISLEVKEKISLLKSSIRTRILF